MAKRRLDILLVERGLAPNSEEARTTILAGEVLVAGVVVSQAATPIDESALIEIVEAPPFVSRGGQKLEGALDAFGVGVGGATVADIGASTGGFTDCLLQRGAAHVHAVDVGYGQLEYGLRQDSRVTVSERTNARHPLPIDEQVDLATIDVSFISLTLVLPNALAVLRPGGRIVALVKPQFEAARGEVGRGGVVRSALVHAQVVGKVCLWGIEHGMRVRGIVASPLLGPKGNREFFVLLEKSA